MNQLFIYTTGVSQAYDKQVIHSSKFFPCTVHNFFIRLLHFKKTYHDMSLLFFTEGTTSTSFQV